MTSLPIGKGSRTLLNYRMYGLPMQIEIEMITWQPPHKSAVKGIVVGSQDTIGARWHFVSNADGSMTWTTKFVLMGRGRLARLREWIAGRMTERLTSVSQ